jgi:hypothetical protein
MLFFTVPTIINVTLPLQGGFGIQIRVELPCAYEATTCPRIALLRFYEVYIIVAITFDHYMDRRHTLRTLNPKIPSFKVIELLIVFMPLPCSRARKPFLHRLSHAQLFF